MSFFVKFNFAAVLALVFALQAAWAAPTAHHGAGEDRRDLKARGGFSFNRWGNINSLNNFDSFFGADNFSGFNNNVVLIQDQLVCSAVDINIVQQQLFVLQEFAKQILLSQICEVEAQFILLDQFRSGFFDFSNDISHLGRNQIGFDSHIAGLFDQLISNGQFNHGVNLGFNGGSIGSQFQVVNGFNWDNSRSPANIAALQQILGQQVHGLGANQVFL